MILKATQQDLPQILELNDKIAENMLLEGFTHWGKNYPNEAIYRRDIKLGVQYVYKIDDNVLGIVSFDIKHHEYFDRIEWSRSNKTAYFAHRLAVDPKFQNQGIAHKLMEYVENQAKKDGIDSIRLGAFKQYDKVVKFYNKRGYKSMGEIVFDVSPIPFLGMEKSID